VRHIVDDVVRHVVVRQVVVRQVVGPRDDDGDGDVATEPDIARSNHAVHVTARTHDTRRERARD
jgi:hypothetical protein